ncbi:MAG: HD domain-containing protein [Candidatus Kerfeldbacteria bacterium]|nr:HD domain-containing protein [Candidatus Kerfeldbacteria bacterium]
MGKIVRLPSRKECELLWHEHATPHHVRAHAMQVSRIARALSRALISAGTCVRIDLVDRASLLHDLIRVTQWAKIDPSRLQYTPTPKELAVWERQRRTFSNAIPHAQVTASVLEHHYPELAHVIALHSFSSVNELRSIEEKIVYYADRRVAHDRIVSLTERMNEAEGRYPAESPEAKERERVLRMSVYTLEEELFSSLDVTPDQLL